MSEIIVRIESTPLRVLSPNKAAHWGTKKKAAEKARNLAKEAAMQSPEWWARYTEDYLLYGKAVVLTWTIWWEKGHKRMDADNLVASLKHYQDGIADALQVNDRRFHVAQPVQERDKNGAGYMECRITLEDVS